MIRCRTSVIGARDFLRPSPWRWLTGGLVPEIANGNRRSGGPRQVVLVVDDEELVRNFMRRVLAGAGYGVVSASNGQDAMVILKSSAVDLVITDIRMPGMDGR